MPSRPSLDGALVPGAVAHLEHSLHPSWVHLQMRAGVGWTSLQLSLLTRAHPLCWALADTGGRAQEPELRSLLRCLSCCVPSCSLPWSGGSCFSGVGCCRASVTTRGGGGTSTPRFVPLNYLFLAVSVNPLTSRQGPPLAVPASSSSQPGGFCRLQHKESTRLNRASGNGLCRSGSRESWAGAGHLRVESASCGPGHRGHWVQCTGDRLRGWSEPSQSTGRTFPETGAHGVPPTRGRTH